MATVNRREACVAAVVTALANITIGNGYLNTLGQSPSRMLEQSDGWPDALLPAVFVDDSATEPSVQYLLNKAAYVTFTLDIAGYTAAAADVNALDADIKRAIASDPTLGGTAMSAVVAPQQVRSSTAVSTRGRFVRPIEITYFADTREGL